MLKIEFTARGRKELGKLPKDLQVRLIKKLKFYLSQENSLQFAKTLINLPPATHRFRVGDYRIAFYIEKNIIYIDRVRHRKEVYYLDIKSPSF